MPQLAVLAYTVGGIPLTARGSAGIMLSYGPDAHLRVRRPDVKLFAGRTPVGYNRLRN